MSRIRRFGAALTAAVVRPAPFLVAGLVRGQQILNTGFVLNLNIL
jgi:hypothetical protein